MRIETGSDATNVKLVECCLFHPRYPLLPLPPVLQHFQKRNQIRFLRCC